MKQNIFKCLGYGLLLLFTLSCTKQKKNTEDFNLGMICPGKNHPAKTKGSKAPLNDAYYSFKIKRGNKTIHSHYRLIGMKHVKVCNVTGLSMLTFSNAGKLIQITFQSDNLNGTLKIRESNNSY